MNVTFICNELPPAPAGGIGYFVNLFAPALAALGHTVHVVGAYDRDYDWQLPGCEVLAVKSRPSLVRRLMQRRFLRHLAPASLIRRLRHKETCSALRQAVRELSGTGEPLLVEWPSYEGHCNWSARGICHILRLHGAAFMLAATDEGSGLKHQASEIATARRIPNWIGVSQWSLDEFRRKTGSPPRRSSVIANPVQPVFFDHFDTRPEAPVVLYAGTLCENKGDDRLARAANTFLPKFPAARLMYIGRHSEKRAEFVRSLIDPSLQDRVAFSGAISQPALARAMQGSSVFALPSRVETFGMVYAEAMASGLPVVGGNATGIPEVVPDGEAGILVDANDVAAISQAVERLLASESLRREMGERGRRIAAEHYSLDACVRKSVAFYAACLEHTPATDFA